MPLSPVQLLASRDRGRVYKLKVASPNRRYMWASILPSGTFGVFTTWGEAMEYQGATLHG